MLDSRNNNNFPEEVIKFINDIVKPTVNCCFEEIEKNTYNLNDKDLKLSLLKKIDKVQFYQEKNFEEIKDEELLNQLQKIISVGFYKLCKLDE